MSKAGSKEAVHHLSHIKWGRVTCKHSFRSITSQYIIFYIRLLGQIAFLKIIFFKVLL